MSPEVKSAINTLRGWKARREANGKAATWPLAMAQALERWPDMDPDDIATVVREVCK
jgi:hypothetical protein